MENIKKMTKELIDAIPNIEDLTMSPSIFSNCVTAHDCDSCPASKGNTGDVFDENVCRECWKNAIENVD